MSRKRSAETQIINNDEAEQTHQEEEAEEKGNEEEDCHFPIPEIPTQIVIDILSCLPIKTLFDCCLVCKGWLSLISDPHFAKLHLPRSQVSLLVKPITHKYKSGKLNLVDLESAPYTRSRNARIKLVPRTNLPKDPNVAFNIVNSCHGFLCLFERVTNDPILGEFITLPKCSSGKIVHSCAFGFSPMTNQYKVVRSFCNGDYYETEIYTLGEGFWRSLGITPNAIRNSSFDTFVNGALHWLCRGYRSPDLIYCFDFASEQFRAVPEPSEFSPVCKQFTDLMRVGVIRGCLSICDFADGDHMDIYLMKEYGVKESWSKDFCIQKMINETRIYDYYEPIMVLESGSILMLVNEGSLLLYDPKLEEYEDVHIYGITSKFHGIAHVPSLVSLRDVAEGENVKYFQRKPDLYVRKPLLLAAQLDVQSLSLWSFLGGRTNTKISFSVALESESRLFGIAVQTSLKK